ncbi:MAG TPA: M20/M25/M40 family metallo-hydrolase [Bryobacteraceae bacterium]|jgi:acetylornithine deacetylase/succinyl-diaminopimelate desuccinylase-like protein|nr:M20/M25/M40 family metallo-hydrolase [Bryobacteraceae bacterium]
MRFPTGLLFVACVLTCSAQDPAALMKDPGIKAALDAVKRNEPHFLEEQVRICEIPAPPFKEEVRSREFERLFKSMGLENVRIDKAGNVIGVRPGRSAHPNLVLAAHLDTVFPEGTDVKVRREGQLLKAPGIGDDTRGLMTMLGVIQALSDARVQTQGTITFVADTGEEGLGDLRGVKNLFNDTLKGQIDAFISIDGSGLSITDVGVGSYRYRAQFKGPGGHSFGAFGMANPIHAMGRAIAKISEFEVPASPKTTFNVGRVGGGTSVNAIPFEAWMEVDMRSSDKASLDALDRKYKAAVQAAVDEENRRWKKDKQVTVANELVGLRPAGTTPGDSPIVRTALAVSGLFGFKGRPGEGSTDSNVPMNLGIPAITIGGGGRGSGAHALDETFDPTDSYLGTQRALVLAVALVQ